MNFSFLLLVAAVCRVSSSPSRKPLRHLRNISLKRAGNGGSYSIIGSKTVSIQKYPYNAAVLTSNGTLIGGGAIYNRQWILTSAWNTYNQSVSNLKVRVGSDNALKGGQVFTLSKMIHHPRYTAEDFDWDVAVLKLSKKIKFSKKAKPIRITKVTPKNNSNATITGWGVRTLLSENADTDKLQELVMEVIDRDTCVWEWYEEEIVNPRSYCAYKEDAEPCWGDFGDPLVQNGKVVGLFLGAYDCDGYDDPGIFADVAKFHSWIVATVKENSHPHELDDNSVVYFGEEEDC